MSSIVFNPFTGQPDFLGSGGSGSPGGAADSIQVNDGASGFSGLNLRIVEGTATTTDAVTPKTLATIALSANTNYFIMVYAIGRATAVGVGAVGDITTHLSRIAASRVGGGASVIDTQGTITGFSFAVNTPPTIDGSPSGNNVLVTITGGDAATTVEWRAAILILSV